MDKKIFTVYMHIVPNMKKYIGLTSIGVKNRWANGKGYSLQPYFYRAINRYGWSNIKHIIIASGLTKAQAQNLEIQLIKLYNTTNNKNGYNRSLGGEMGFFRMNHSEKSKQKISDSKYKPILQFDNKMNFVKEFRSLLDAGEYYNINCCAISNCCKGKTKLSYNCIWKFKEDCKENYSTSIYDGKITKHFDFGKYEVTKETIEKIIKAKKGVPLSTKHKVNIGLSNRRPILQFDKEMNFIQEWDSATTAGKYLGIGRSSIYACCIGRTNSAGGFIWVRKHNL